MATTVGSPVAPPPAVPASVPSAHARGLPRVALNLLTHGPRSTPATSSVSTSAPSADAIAGDGHRVFVERLLAAARLVAAGALTIATLAGETRSVGVPAPLLMGAYTAYAATVLLLLLRMQVIGRRVTHGLHVADLLWAVAGTLASGGVASNVFPLFAFVLVASAYRWGLKRTLADGAIIVCIAVAEIAAATTGIVALPTHSDLFVVRVTYIGVLAVLLGALSERQHAIGFEAAALGGLMARIGRATGVRTAVRDALSHCLHLFEAREAVVVVQDLDTRRMFTWSAWAYHDGSISITEVELRGRDRERWRWTLPANVAACRVRRQLRRPEVGTASLAIDANGHAIGARRAEVDTSWWDASWQSVAAARVDLAPYWSGHLFLINPTWGPQSRVRLGVLASLVAQVSPVLHNLRIAHRLRSRAAYRERAHLGRELHDGVAQTLAAVQMELDLLTRYAEQFAPRLVDDLSRVRDLLHLECVNLRELMEAARPVDVDALGLHPALEDVVSRFARTEVQVRLDWHAAPLDLTPHHCREVVRIVTEALVNARRHGHASEVAVRVVSDAVSWTLLIDDNGQGFPFAGRVPHDELVACQQGPRVIRERVVAMRGTLEIESWPGRTRLEMRFPRRPPF